MTKVNHANQAPPCSLCNQGKASHFAEGVALNKRHATNPAEPELLMKICPICYECWLELKQQNPQPGPGQKVGVATPENVADGGSVAPVTGQPTPSPRKAKP